MGLPLRFGHQPARRQQPSCFASSTAADLVHLATTAAQVASKGLAFNSAGINDLGIKGAAIDGLGVKRIGSAQHWRSGCLLQHGTILLAPPAALWQELFGVPAPSLPPLPLASGELESLLLECAAASFPLAPVGELTVQELAAIEAARPNYRVDPQAAG
jgi:lipoate-protein ligase A